MELLQRLPVDEAELGAFCRRWKIAKLELFGSTLIDPSRAKDVDLLVTFAEDARWGLFEHEHMQNELAGLFGRSVDLISRRAIETSRNALRRNAILGSAVLVYVAEREERHSNPQRSGCGVFAGDGLRPGREPV